MKKFLSFFTPGFLVDLRSLAFMRILIGLTLIMDLVLRLFDLRFYTDPGLLPTLPSIFPVFSIHLLNGSVYFQIALFALTIIAAVFLILGFKTKLAAISCWLLYVSLINRNPFINSGADYLLVFLLLIGIFLPWHLRFSLDSKRHENSFNPIITIGTLAYIFHVILLYCFTGLFKINEGWMNNDVLFTSLAYLPFQQPFGLFLLQFPTLVYVLQITVPVFEILSPLLIIFPFKNSFCRSLAIFGLIFLHLGIWLSMELGLFSLVAIVGLVGLIPANFWQYLKLYREFSSKNSKKIQNSTTASLIVILIIVYVFFSNLVYFLKLNPGLPFLLKLPNILTAIPSKWDMYSAHTSNSYWLHIVGVSAENNLIEYPSGNRVINFEKPTFDTFFHQNHRWKKYINSVLQNHAQGFTKNQFAQYLCRQTSPEFKRILFYRTGKRIEKDRSYTLLPTKVIHTYSCPPKP